MNKEQLKEQKEEFKKTILNEQGKRFTDILNYLKAKGINQTMLAKLFVIDQTGVSNYAKGKNFIPFENLHILLTKYKININWLLSGKGSMLIPEEKSGFKYRLLELQAESGLDDRDFSKKIGVSESELDRLGTGKLKPTVDVLHNIKKEFNKSTDYMLYGE